MQAAARPVEGAVADDRDGLAGEVDLAFHGDLLTALRERLRDGRSERIAADRLAGRAAAGGESDRQHDQ